MLDTNFRIEEVTFDIEYTYSAPLMTPRFLKSTSECTKTFLVSVDRFAFERRSRFVN